MARIKKQEHEKLDDTNIRRIISLLEPEEGRPITKKAACEMLRINYSTKRLGNIIDDYKERRAFEVKRRKALRGKPIKDAEGKYIILEYLKGDSISSLSKSTYRSVLSVKKYLIDNQVPLHGEKTDYFNPVMVPDENLKEEYESGEYAWSVQYNCLVQVKKLIQVHKDFGNIYNVWVFGNHDQWASLAWAYMADLPVLKKFNIKENELA
jgi:hypothetical protein